VDHCRPHHKQEIGLAGRSPLQRAKDLRVLINKASPQNACGIALLITTIVGFLLGRWCPIINATRWVADSSQPWLTCPALKMLAKGVPTKVVVLSPFIWHCSLPSLHNAWRILHNAWRIMDHCELHLPLKRTRIIEFYLTPLATPKIMVNFTTGSRIPLSQGQQSSLLYKVRLPGKAQIGTYPSYSPGNAQAHRNRMNHLDPFEKGIKPSIVL